jgi:hypothetical protein
MRRDQDGVKIPLQVASELLIKNTGEIAMSNPELELANADAAADAVLVYRFDRQADEHVLRLHRATQVSSHVGVRLAVPLFLHGAATEPSGYGKPYPYVRTGFFCR